MKALLLVLLVAVSFSSTMTFAADLGQGNGKVASGLKCKTHTPDGADKTSSSSSSSKSASSQQQI